MDKNSIIGPSGVPKTALTEIARHLERPDLISLCLTSRAFWNIVISHLYRNLSFKSADQAARCFQTIISRPEIAICVKDVAMTFESTNPLTPDFYQLAARALCCASLVQGLEISSLEYAGDGLPVVESGEMRSLYQFNLPKLRKLIAGTVSTFRYLNGPCPLLQYARITWNDLSATDTVCSFLSSSPDLHHLDNIVSVRDMPSLSTIGAHVPHIKHLTLRLQTNQAQMFKVTLNRFHDSLKKDIGSFNGILTLAVITVDANEWMECNLDLEDVDDDFDLVTSLGQLCPSLCIIATYRGLIWKRHRTGTWVPLFYSKKDEWWCYTAKLNGTGAEYIWVGSYEPPLPREDVMRMYVWDRAHHHHLKRSMT